jgi:hypothetical protein
MSPNINTEATKQYKKKYPAMLTVLQPEPDVFPGYAGGGIKSTEEKIKGR